MKAETENLMKHFASVLRGIATGNLESPSISKNTVRYLSRKELIEIVKKRFNGNIPKEHNLLELENEELLELVGDEMYVIAYVTDRWTKQTPPKVNGQKVTTPVKPVTPKKDTSKPTDRGSKSN